jgi:hypothetical protein
MKTSFLIWTRRLRERRGARLHGATRVGEGIVESMDPVLPRPPPRIFPCSRAPLSPPPSLPLPPRATAFPPARNRPPPPRRESSAAEEREGSRTLSPAVLAAPHSCAPFIPNSRELWLVDVDSLRVVGVRAASGGG